MQLIDFDLVTNKISVLDDESWKVIIHNKDTRPLKEIQLDLETTSYRTIAYFKVLGGEETIQLAYKEDGGVFYHQFDMDGSVSVNKRISNNTDDILIEIDSTNNFDILFMDERNSYTANCKIFNKNNEILGFNLKEAIDNSEKDWDDYEYIECLKSTNKPFQLAFIAVDANYGVEGVKVFQITGLKKLNLVYDMDDLDFDGAIHNLTFNFRGDRFILLLYERDQDSNDHFSICEYSVPGNNKPSKIFKTNLGYWIHGPLYTQYLTDSLLCIVRRTDIVLFNLSNGNTQEILERDSESAYYVSFNILIYKINHILTVLEF